MARIGQAALTFGNRRVMYDSPSQGLLEFGWTGPLRQRGAVVPLGDYPRYDNPYVRADFPPAQIEVRCGEDWLRLDWPAAGRQASAFL